MNPRLLIPLARLLFSANLALIGLGIILLVGQPVWAASPPVDQPQPFPEEPDTEGVLSTNTTLSPQWTQYTVEQGLISNHITAMFVQNGLMWIGTDAGISRFDGRWRNHAFGVASISGYVTAFAEDPATGQLWAATDSGQLLARQDEEWITIYVDSRSIHALIFVDGQIWLGTDSGIVVWTGNEAVQISELDPDAVEIQDQHIQAFAASKQQVWVGTSDGLWTRQPSGWFRQDVENGLPSVNITTLWSDQDTIVWVGTDTGAAVLDPLTGSWTPIITKDQFGLSSRINSINSFDGQVVWAATEHGVFRFDRSGAVVQLPGFLGLTTAFVTSVVVDSDEYVWLGTVAGIFRYEGNLWLFESRSREVANEGGDITVYNGINNVTALLIGENDSLWIATNGSGIRYKEFPVTSTQERYFTTSDSQLPSNYVYALAKDQWGTIWAGTSAGLARYRDGQWDSAIPDQSLPSTLISVIQVDGQRIWFGTDIGLSYLDQATQAVVQIPELGDANITAGILDLNGRLWIGTANQGVFMEEKPGIWRQFTIDDGLSSNRISAVTLDPNRQHGVWVGHSDVGVNHWDGSRWQSFGTADSLPSNVVYTVYTSPADSSVWIGGEGGVTRFDGKTVATFPVEDGTLSASISAIVRAESGGYWFGGQDGLTFYRPENMPPTIELDDSTLPVLETLGSGADGSISYQSYRIEASEKTVQLPIFSRDLHTSDADLVDLYRISGPGHAAEWQILDAPLLSVVFSDVGTYKLELRVRDLSFNYSDIHQYNFDIVSPPLTIDLPIFGAMPQDVFRAMVALGLIALVGFTYASYEMLTGHRRKREAISRSYNPYISGEPVRREDMFFGREDLLQRIVDTLHHNSIMIHGERRIGKTTLLYQLAARLREVDDPDYWFVPIYIDLEGTAESVFFHYLIEEIAQGLETLPKAHDTELVDALQQLHFHNIPAEKYSDRIFNNDLHKLTKGLETYGHAHTPDRRLRLILLLDEMDVMSQYDHLVQQQLRRIFMRDFASTLGAVVAGIEISKEWDRIESPWYNLFNEIALKPFNREQSIELLTQPVQEYYRYTPTAIEAILEHSSGRPYRLQQYGLESVNHMLSVGRQRIVLDDVEVAHNRITMASQNGTGDQAGLSMQDDAEARVQGEYDAQN